MTYENPRDPTPSVSRSIGLVPIVAAALLVLLLLWAFVPRNTTSGVNDTTNAGPSVKTVTPAPSPSTPTVPTPNPTTERPNTPPAQ